MSFTVYKSSAGSGKTFTLVKEYLAIVLNEPNRFRHVLAITFTNKAANEMKERVLKYLKGLAADDPEQVDVKFLLPQLIEKTGLNGHTIAQRAGQVLTLILHNYSDFAISTIDSFVHRIIRSFAHDLHLPVNFEVELDGPALLQQAVDVLISRVGTDEQLTRLLVEFTEGKADEEKNWHIDGELYQASTTLLSEEGRQYASRLELMDAASFFETFKKLDQQTRKFELRLSTFGQQAMELIQTHKLNAKDFYYSTRGIYAHFSRLAKGDFSKLEPNSYVVKTIENGNWASGKADASIRQTIDGIAGDLTAIFQQITIFLDQEQERYRTYHLLRQNLYPLAVLNQIEQVLQELQRAGNILHISEFNRRIAEVVLNEPVPFIYERLGEHYKHFLIDEFQDTSVMQWHNLLPLLENSLAEAHFNMIVGDGKQAIYRWRSGEVEQFAVLPHVYGKEKSPLSAARESILIRNYKEKHLESNYRSRCEVVDFNNRFFAYFSSLLEAPYANIYDQLKQEFNPQNSGGMVQIEFVEAREDESMDDCFLAATLKTIQQQCETAYQYKDIAVLTRSNSTGALVAAALLEAGIPVISAESLLLESAPVVSFLIQTVRVLSNHQDQLAQAGMLKYLTHHGLLGNLKFEQTLSVLSRKNLGDNGMDAQIKDFYALLRAYDFDFDPNYLVMLPLYELIESLIRMFGLNAQPDVYLQFFLDALIKYTNNNLPDIKGFLDWWEQKKAGLSVVVPEGTNAVRVLTVHKSKGLEFPLVICPFIKNIKSERFTNSNLWVDFKDDLLEDLPVAWLPARQEMEQTRFSEHYLTEKNKSQLDLVNLWYVAFTRPVERLCIISQMPPENGKAKGVPIMLQGFLQADNKWNTEQRIYQYGEGASLPKRKQSSDKMLGLKSFIASDWRSQIRMSYTAPDVWDVEDPDRNVRWGNLVHYALSHVNGPADLSVVVESMVVQGLLDEPETFLQQLQKVVNHPQLEAYYQSHLQHKNEAEILLPNGKTYRPDRVVLNEQQKQAVVIDYKTGQALVAHEEQIMKYGQLLQAMDYKDIRLLLVYIDDEVEVRVVTAG